MAHKILLLSILLASGVALASLPAEMSGTNLMATGEVKIPTSNKDGKGTVVVFLSAKCPCSDSHIAELKTLAEKYKVFKFVGIHSNVDEDMTLAKKYFTAQAPPFPILQDEKAIFADAFKAYKTPHAYVLSSGGEVVFQGGVSDSANGKEAKIHYLADALEDLQKNRKIRTPMARTLGCVILREKNTW